jgi:hypothetical protein
MDSFSFPVRMYTLKAFPNIMSSHIMLAQFPQRSEFVIVLEVLPLFITLNLADWLPCHKRMSKNRTSTINQPLSYSHSTYTTHPQHIHNTSTTHPQHIHIEPRIQEQRRLFARQPMTSG